MKVDDYKFKYATNEKCTSFLRYLAEYLYVQNNNDGIPEVRCVAGDLSNLMQSTNPFQALLFMNSLENLFEQQFNDGELSSFFIIKSRNPIDIDDVKNFNENINSMQERISVALSGVNYLAKVSFENKGEDFFQTIRGFTFDGKLLARRKEITNSLMSHGYDVFISDELSRPEAIFHMIQFPLSLLTMMNSREICGNFDNIFDFLYWFSEHFVNDFCFGNDLGEKYLEKCENHFTDFICNKLGWL